MERLEQLRVDCEERRPETCRETALPSIRRDNGGVGGRMQTPVVPAVVPSDGGYQAIMGR
jgi:hypothetical protein